MQPENSVALRNRAFTSNYNINLESKSYFYIIVRIHLTSHPLPKVIHHGEKYYHEKKMLLFILKQNAATVSKGAFF